MDGPEFRTVFAGVRPPRLAVLIDKGDADWQETCRRIMECLASTWGGKYSIIIPTDGLSIDSVFWEMMEAFDPDYICEYMKTGLDWKIGSPQRYEKLLEESLKAKYPDETPPANTVAAIDGALSKTAFESTGTSPALQKELKVRIAPFFFEDDAVQYSFEARSETVYPLTDLSTILPHCQHPDILVVAETTIEGIPPIWVDSLVGGAYPEQTARTTACGISIRDVRLGLGDVFRLMTAQLGLDKQAPPECIAGGPFAFSMVALSEYRSLAERTWELPAVVVVGSTVRDFALYFGLSRIRERVCWLWLQWLEEFKTANLREKSGGLPVAQSEEHASVLADVLDNALTTRTIKNIDFVSASLNDAAIARVIDELSTSSPHISSAIKTQGRICGSTQGLFKQPRVVFNTDNYAIPTTQQVLEGKAVGFFPTPKPKGFTTIVPSKHRWITELRVEGLAYPRHPALGGWLIDHRLLSSQGARTSKQGLSYFCPNVAYFGGDIDTILVRPVLRVPTAETVFQKLAESAGVSAKTSDKGFFSRDLVQKMGGLEYAAALLREPRHFAVLTAYLSDAQTPAAPGKYLGSDRRLYLSLENVNTILDSPAEAVSLIDILVGRGLMHRGTILKCQYCRTADWFSMKDLDNEFTCKRCARKQSIQSRHALGAHEPVWYYKLDEIVYQGLRNDMHAPLLALDYLRRKNSAFSYADELELWRTSEPKPFIEIDLCCICDGTLTIGEVKTTGRIEDGGKRERRSLAKYREAAVLLGARRFILATSQAWSAGTLANAKAAFANTNVDVVPIEGSQILTAF